MIELDSERRRVAKKLRQRLRHRLKGSDMDREKSEQVIQKLRH